LNINYSKRDIIDFILLYIGAIITVYLLPGIFAYIYFGILLILFWRSRKNAFWFILLYFMLDTPGDLFPNDFNYGLPFVNGVNLRYIEVFIYVAFFKALRQKNRFQSQYYKAYQFLLILTILLLVYTLFLDTFSLSFIITIKWIFVWSIIYSIPKLIDTYDEWVFFFRMAFIIVFIGFLSQLLQLALGQPPSYLLGTNFQPMMGYEKGIPQELDPNLNFGEIIVQKLDPNQYNVIEARPISCITIMQLALTGAMFFLQFKTHIFNKTYLYLVIIISYLSILLTATRGWFIAFSVVLILYFAYSQKIKRIYSISILVIILLLFLLRVPFIQKQFQGSFSRLSTIESVAQGDLSAGGTSSRDQYSFELIKLWKESPVLGWGFSSFFKEHNNGHAGPANLLFSVGIVGYLVFIYFWYKLFFIPIRVNKRISFSNPYKGSLIIFSFTFLVFFILHASSGQRFGLYLDLGAVIFSQVIYYSYSSFFIVNALNEEYEIKQLHRE
jgi:hypothetical protein